MLLHFTWPLEALCFDTFQGLDSLIKVVLLQSEIRITFWVLHFPEPTLRPPRSGSLEEKWPLFRTA